MNFREVPGQTALRSDGAPPVRTVFRSDTERRDPSAYPVHLDAVVDLRRDDERERVPHPLAALTDYRSVPLFDPASPIESDAAAVQLEDQYIDWLERHRSSIAAVFRTLAASQGSVLICCSAGKDRTGLVSAILERLWDVDIDTVGADYAASGPLLADRFRAELEATEDLAATLVSQRCVPEIMTTVINTLEQTYGSAQQYLRSIGLTEAEVTALSAATLPRTSA